MSRTSGDVRFRSVSLLDKLFRACEHLGVTAVSLQSVLDGMPDPADLRAAVHDGRTFLMVGDVVLAAYDNEDVGLRNLALISLTEMGFPVHAVSRLVGLTPEYGSELRGQVRREGSARLVRGPGRPPKLTEAQVRQARGWKAAGVREAEIGRASCRERVSCCV